jgi:dTDP-4-dehydrorhamnose 3,5-epimerase-like enzyme
MKSHEAGIMYNDPIINIQWPIEFEKMILSEKDLNNKLLKDAPVL